MTTKSSRSFSHLYDVSAHQRHRGVRGGTFVRLRFDRVDTVLRQLRMAHGHVGARDAHVVEPTKPIILVVVPVKFIWRVQRREVKLYVHTLQVRTTNWYRECTLAKRLRCEYAVQLK